MMLGILLLFLASWAAGTESGTPRFGAWLTYWEFNRGLERVRTAPGLFDDILFFVAALGRDGRPALARPELLTDPIVRELRSRGVRSWLTVVNDLLPEKGGRAILKDAHTVHWILSDPSAGRTHRHAIVELAARYGFSGVDLDYENLKAQERDRFSLFVRELAADLAAKGLRLSVTVQPKRHESRSDGPGATDWRQLCRTADRLQIMLYNLHSAKTGPGPLATPAWIGDVLAFARTQCDPARIVPVLKVSGMDWGPGGVKAVSHAEAAALAEAYEVAIQREPEGEAPFFRYVSSEGSHTVYFEDATSIVRKVAVLERLGYDRIVLWSLGREDPQLLSQLLSRKGASPQAGDLR